MKQRRKRLLLILLIVFLFAAFAGGSKLRDRELNRETGNAVAQAEQNGQPSPEGTATAGTSATSTPASGASATPTATSTPGEQNLSVVPAADATPSSTASPTGTPTPLPTASPTTNPTASPTPNMTMSGVSGRMILEESCSNVQPTPGMTMTCLPYAYQGTAGLYKSGSNQFIKNVTGGSDGSFMVMLEPGSYYFMASGSPSLEKTTVIVPAQGFATVTLTFKN